MYNRLDNELADAVEVIGSILPDSIVAAVKRLARENDLPDPGSLFQTLPMDSKGRLPFHQAENALELAGLTTAPLDRRVAFRKKQNSCLRSSGLNDDSVAIIYEATKDQAVGLESRNG